MKTVSMLTLWMLLGVSIYFGAFYPGNPKMGSDANGLIQLIGWIGVIFSFGGIWAKAVFSDVDSVENESSTVEDEELNH
ncbi:hypothetical protein ACFL2R_00880 [Patescibacteria group bacterium]